MLLTWWRGGRLYRRLYRRDRRYDGLGEREIMDMMGTTTNESIYPGLIMSPGYLYKITMLSKAII
jgi:hypothetical protein